MDIEDLRPLIGQRIRGGKCVYTIVEVLDEGPSVILESESRFKIIQENQHGIPSRRSRHTITMPVLSPDGRDWNPALKDLLSIIANRDRYSR